MEGLVPVVVVVVAEAAAVQLAQMGQEVILVEPVEIIFRVQVEVQAIQRAL